MDKKQKWEEWKLKLKFWFKLILLSPGIILHEMAHATFCLISGTKIIDIKIFQFSEVAGFVQHEKAKDFFGAFFISYGPLIINTITSHYFFKVFNFDYHLKNILALYLGISIALSAIPSDADTGNFGSYIKEKVITKPWFFFLFIFYPLVWFLNLLNYLKKFYFDYILVGIIFYWALFL